MTVYAYFVAGVLVLLGGVGIARSKDLVNTVICLSIAQSGTYVLLISIGFQQNAPAPVFGSTTPPTKNVVDPVVQAMTLTDIVVSATITALLLAIQIANQHHTVNPDELQSLKG